MHKPLIKIAYRQVIDISSEASFEKDVFEDSYQEFLLQAQAYNRDNKFSSFEELKSNNPKANSLHYKVGFSIGLYIRSLQNQIKIPQENGVAIQLPFEVSEFEIIQSSITDNKLHRVAITYTTGMCTLLRVLGDICYCLRAIIITTKIGRRLSW
jgi:hypothetical protein